MCKIRPDRGKIHSVIQHQLLKPLLMGGLAVLAIAVVIGLGVNAVDASGAVGGVAFVLGACVAGLIGGAVSRRMPPPRQQR